MTKFFLFLLIIIGPLFCNFETKAYPNGVSNFTSTFPCVIISSSKYSLMLKDAMYGQIARNTIIPKYELTVEKLQMQQDNLKSINESLLADLKEVRKAYYAKTGYVVLFTVGGVAVGVGVTVLIYKFVLISTN